MTKYVSAKAAENSNNPTADKTAKPIPTKHSQVIAMLAREDGASLEEMSAKANWLTHSTRAFIPSFRVPSGALIVPLSSTSRP